ncbi:Uncharacterised protein [Sphingobacterium spiritivorum]|uniref:Uncharacterized protein n=1 Tax=Sphingobacterium spiritivorum TaxID=258 RepID=A0A380C679_SPHSI|nr:Uncharacterised protein [Sphingobacterium spiritivorum]
MEGVWLVTEDGQSENFNIFSGLLIQVVFL